MLAGAGNTIRDILVENVRVRYLKGSFNFQNFGGNFLDLSLRGNVILHAYLFNVHNAVVRNNAVLRASSLGLDFRSDNPADASNILVHDNLFVEGEVGLSISGQGSSLRKFNGVTVTDNVFLHIGRSRPTDRYISWALNLDGVYGSNSLVSGNLFALQEAPSLAGNSFAIKTMVNNENLPPAYTSLLTQLFPGGYSLSANHYYSADNGNQWFPDNLTNRVANSGRAAYSGELKPLFSPQTGYPDPSVRLEGYITSLGLGNSDQDFLNAIRGQSANTWNVSLEAAAINHYFRAGFGI